MIEATTGATTLTRVPLVNSEGTFDEAFLQKLMFDHPEVIPLSDIENGFDDLVSICREMPTPHGFIDNLFVTARGQIAVAEAKLWRNPEARRKVVAQALDYASCLSAMTFAEFETRALGARGDGKRSLWELIPEHEQLPEAEFIDAVTRNLSRGRILLLIVGDGIRGETEVLTDLLQSHAGAHFTLVLIELAVYALPAGAQVVIPRTMLKTKLVERGVVRIEDRRTTVSAPPAGATSGTAAPTFAGNVNSDEYFELIGERFPSVPEALKRFLSQLEPLNIYPDYRRALNLKWEAPSGRTINLGILQRDGMVWTSEAGAELGQKYNEELARIWGGRAEPSKWGTQTKWQVKIAGRVPRIDEVADKLDDWVDVLRRLIPTAAEASLSSPTLPPPPKAPAP